MIKMLEFYEKVLKEAMRKNFKQILELKL